MQNHRENIFDYCCYRTFLRTHYQLQKQRQATWSYGVWTRRLGLSNTSSLINVVRGARHPGKKLISILTRYFNMQEDQAEYFRSLVLLEKQGQSSKLQSLLIEKFKKNKQAAFTVMDDKTFQAISQWHFYAARESVNLADFVEDSDWLADRLQFVVVRPEIRKALRTLEQLKLLQRNSRGKLVYSNVSLTTPTDVANPALRIFHRQMIELALQSLEDLSVEQRDITACTFAVRKKDLAQIKERIRSFRKSLMDEFENLGNADEVFQLNVQFFPLTRTLSKQKKKESS